MVVAGMAAHTDINRAHEVANEVRRIHKQLKEAQTLASTYNNRERLFGMPVTNVRIFFLFRTTYVVETAECPLRLLGHLSFIANFQSELLIESSILQVY